VKPAPGEDVTVSRMCGDSGKEEISPYPSPRDTSPRYAGNTSLPGTPSPVPANIPPLHLPGTPVSVPQTEPAPVPQAVQALPPAHLTGGMEAPAGTTDMGSCVRGVDTAEQQARLGVDENGDKVQAAAAPASLSPRGVHRPPPPGPPPAPPSMPGGAFQPSAFQRMLPPPPMPPNFKPSVRPAQQAQPAPAAAPAHSAQAVEEPIVIMNSVITYVDQEPEPVPEPPKPPKPVRVDIAGGSYGYATVMVGVNDTAADVAVKVASKRDCRCFTLRAQNCDGVKWSLSGQDLVNPLLNVGTVLIGIECPDEDQEAALGNSYRLS